MKALKFLQNVITNITAPLETSIAQVSTQVQSTVPIGTVFAYYGINAPENYLLCNGSEFDKDEYSELFTLLGKNTTPDLRNKTVMGGGTLGAASDGSLPNITGSYNNVNNAPATSGAFTYAQDSSEEPSSISRAGGKISFNASRCSSLYKDNQTYVEPANIRMSYIIRAKL